MTDLKIHSHNRQHIVVIPAKAGIHVFQGFQWTPTFTGVTDSLEISILRQDLIIDQPFQFLPFDHFFFEEDCCNLFEFFHPFAEDSSCL